MYQLYLDLAPEFTQNFNLSALTLTMLWEIQQTTKLMIFFYFS